MNPDIAVQLARVRARLHAACLAAARPPESVRLLAVSKTRPAEDVRTAARAAQLDFGENYAQELRDKAREVGANPEFSGLRWHFIGHLQRNKARYVAGVCELVHTVDTLELAQELARRAPHAQGVLVQVNVGDEASKSGVAVDEALRLCEALMLVPNLAVRGLMTIPPAREDPAEVAPFFRILRELAEEGRRRGLPLVELSMGMSSDFEVAVAEGSTIVRVGTSIFGARAKPTLSES